MGMSRSKRSSPELLLCVAKNQLSQLPVRSPQGSVRLVLAGALLFMVAATASKVSAQGTLSLLGTNAPAVLDNGDPNSVVLGVRVFSDVPGKVLGWSEHHMDYRGPIHFAS